LQILDIKSFSGRNIYSHKPVIKMVIDVGNLYDTPTKDIKGFNEKLLELFPGLKKHYCSLGYEGGFAERLESGTYLPHVTEHLILEIQNMLGYQVSYGKTRNFGKPSIYYIVVQYENEPCAVACCRTGVKIIQNLVEGIGIDVDDIMRRLRRISEETDLGPSSKAIYEEARKRQIPVRRMDSQSLLQLGYGKYSRLVQASMTDGISCISADIASNKHVTKQILSDNGIPVPFGQLAYDMESAISAANEIGYPVVVKPYDGNQGKGVTLDIGSENELKQAYQEAVRYSDIVIVEKYIKGKDYRILVVGDKVCAVAERRPPLVIGDGIHSIKELVEIENMNPLRGNDHEKPLTKIKLDNVAKAVISRKGFDENSVPAKGEDVPLRENGNLSTGGTARNCTDEIHEYNKQVAVKAAKLIGLDIAGIDMTIEDISVPLSSQNGAVIEVNAAPGLRMHLYPTEGKAINVAADIIEFMYPKDRPVSIPIISITGTNGKTTTTRLVGHTASLMGICCGMTTTSGVYVGKECILKGDNTGPVSARMVLSNKNVDMAVLETARGGIVRKGLGYDLADVGVIVNISDDHLGIDGMETLEDIAHAKALVIEAVKPEGYSVINADDEMAEYLMKRAAGNIILFSRSSKNPKVLDHMAKGGTALFVDKSEIFIFDGSKTIRLIKIKDIPICFGGMVECNIENSLAAASALYAVNIPVEVIRKGLKTFMPDVEQNPGRFNIFDMGDFKVMLDYSHNPAGYKCVTDFIKKTDAKRLVGIIGMPGDRLDSSIRKAARICCGVFSKIYIKEDNDLRGRQAGEVAGIFYDEIIKGGVSKDDVEIIYSETKALETAIMNAQPGDLIVMFYENFEPNVEIIKNYIKEREKTMAEAVLTKTAG